MSERIRVDDDAYAALAALRGEGETFDELISRLLDERRESVRDGAGLWADSDAPEAARAKRTEMKGDVDFV